MSRAQSRVPPSFFLALGELLRRRQPAVVVTVVESRGSAPGKTGGKMIVTSQETLGTVGGGRVEFVAVTHARAVLAGESEPGIESYDVVRDLGMTCGGAMTLLYERHQPSPRVVIFGAGHVSRYLCSLAGAIGFEVVVCDDRPDWLTEEGFPAAAQRTLGSVADGVAHVDEHTLVVSVYPQHALDLEVARQILKLESRPRYLGVIGSKRKAVLFRKELEQEGFDPETLEWIRLPVGIDIGAKDPGEIAVSILAELVATLRKSEALP